MRSIHIGQQGAADWDGKAPFTFDDTEPVSPHSLNSHRSDSPLTGISSGMSPRRVPVPIMDHDQNHGLGFGVGFGHTFNDTHRETASTARSSPSIYPASLPPSGDDDVTETTQSPDTEHSPVFSFRSLTGPAPPRPPRSHLRQSSTKFYEMYPVTPPTSVSSHEPSKPPSPILDQAKAIQRRTLLDVSPAVQFWSCFPSPYASSRFALVARNRPHRTE